MVNAPRTVKDAPANEFVISLAQYFRSSGKVRRWNRAFRWVLEREMIGVSPFSHLVHTRKRDGKNEKIADL